MKQVRNKIKERKDRERELKINEILKAARKIFFSKGFLKTTMDEIADEAGLSKPTIYKFFPAKEDLYFSLVLPVLQEFLHEMEEIHLHLQLNMFNSGDKLLRDVMNVFFKKYTDNPELFRIGQLFQLAGMLWSLDKKTENSIRDVSKAIMSEMRSLFDTAVRLELVKDMDRHILTEVIVGSVFGITQFQDTKLKSNRESRLNSVIQEAMGLFSDSVALK